MCLITKQKQPIILKEDKVVYKILAENMYEKEEARTLYSPAPITYILGMEYHAPITFGDGIDVDVFDRLCMDAVDEEWNVKPGYCEIKTGFSFATTKERLRDALQSSVCITNNIHIYRCVIPKGSKVYYDDTGLGVSNCIIVKK